MLTIKGYKVDATLLPLIEVTEFRKGKYLYQTGICITRCFMTWQRLPNILLSAFGNLCSRKSTPLFYP